MKSDSSLFDADTENTPIWNNLNLQLRDTGPVLDQAHYNAAAAALDPLPFAEYMMTNQISQTQDWPGSNFSLNAPHDSSIRGWRFTAEGADQSLVAEPGNELAWWDNLRANPHFRELFADLIQKHMIAPDGAFTAPVLKARYQAEMDIIRSPLAAESARWGDSMSSLRTPIDHWEPLVTNTRDNLS